MVDSYITCVATELDTMIQVYNKHIVPRCIAFNGQNQNGPERLKKLFQAFDTAFDGLLESKEILDAWQSRGVKSIEVAQEVREYLWKAGVRVDTVSRFLPRDQGWPEWDEFLLV